MTKSVSNNQRVEELLRAMRERTREELTQGLLLLGDCWTPEMMRALELLSAERAAEQKREA
ncbi:hypothetical protein [Bradyrhizobium sp. USDA 4473]